MTTDQRAARDRQEAFQHLTPMQQRFAKALPTSRSGTEAAKRAGSTDPKIYAHQTLRSNRFKAAMWPLLQALKQKGVTLGRVATVYREALDATHWEGETFTPDHTIRLRSADRIAEFHGFLKADAEATTPSQAPLVIWLEQHLVSPEPPGSARRDEPPPEIAEAVA